MFRFVTTLMLAATVPVLAACGGSNSNATSALASTKAAQGIAFAKCMRTHGVPNFPDPSGSSGGLQIQASDRAGSGQSLKINGVSVNAPAFQSAMKACQSFMPHRQLSGAQLAAFKRNAVKFSACMRSHGVPDFPDPQIQSGPGGGVGVRIGGPGSRLNPNSPAFQSAQKACGSLIGGPGTKFQAPAG